MKAKTLKNRNPLGSLKDQYLRCFGTRVNSFATLQDAIRGLVDRGITRETLVAWASDAGFPKATIRSVLSRLFVSLGLRERQKGAGRRPSPSALILADYARRRYGKNFVNVLRAAWRVGKAQLAAEDLQTGTNGRALGLIAAPQLGGLRIGSRRTAIGGRTPDFTPKKSLNRFERKIQTHEN